jgi:hypothetical protein
MNPPNYELLAGYNEEQRCATSAEEDCVANKTATEQQEGVEERSN